MNITTNDGRIEEIGPRLIEMPDSVDELGVLQRQLEKYQKYRSQHPELYAGARLDVMLSPALLSTQNLYFYFIPFHLLFNISVILSAKSVCCHQCLHNIGVLSENNIAVSSLISH
ncbi:TPA: hypothetical protein PKO72_003770 [Aeromonas hydrophila]|uniref:hypothetical protein n=1 Tax=Aeromonas hydrophila TaxID=644 RepID=UPI001CCA3B69|nr:hypothetical protein [Aeromonas hydrophila]UBQ49544.1 hypothetical protein LCH17_16925 [Aeromonas hydrophila]HDI1214987.1 hypothetical protein [Aeromonas hydrophila]